MNGLKYIRTRCNLSLNDVAEAIGVTRQALSSWENERKEIPEQRKKELADYFGIDAAYFGEIFEKEKKYLLEKAMFRYEEDGKETYRYKPQEGEKQLKRIYFPGDDQLSLDERYIEAQKKKKELISDIEEAIKYTDNAGSIQSQIVCINRGCGVYGMITRLMQEMKKQDVINRMTYFYEILNVLEAMMAAYGLIDKNVIEENIELNKEFQKEDGEWILELADMLERRWDEKVSQQKKRDAEFRNQQKAGVGQPAEQELSVEEQIAQAEEHNREFCEMLEDKITKLNRISLL